MVSPHLTIKYVRLEGHNLCINLHLQSRLTLSSVLLMPFLSFKKRHCCELRFCFEKLA